MSFLERCTEGAKRALALAQEAARAMGHNYVGSEHLLLGLIREGEGGAYRALSAFGGRTRRPRRLSLHRQLRLHAAHKEDPLIEPL